MQYLRLFFAINSTSVESEENNAKNDTNDVYIIEEDKSKRNEFEKHYLCSDGTFIAVSYPEAIHYQENGEWIDVDNTLTLDTKTGFISTANKNFNVNFSQNADSNKLISIEKDKYKISWDISALSSDKTILGLSKTAQAGIKENQGQKASGDSKRLIENDDTFNLPKASGQIKYSNIFGTDDNISLNYTVYQNKVEEDIILNEKSDISSFVMKMDIGKLTAKLCDDNSIILVDLEGNTVYTIGIPYMVDSADEVLNNIVVTIKQNGSSCEITYTPDREWLNSDEREYPIILDPSITTNEYSSNIVDTYVQQNDTANHSSEQRLYTGIRSGNINRTFLKIQNLPNIDSSMGLVWNQI